MTATLFRRRAWYKPILLGSLLAVTSCQTPPGAPGAPPGAPEEPPAPFRYELTKEARVDLVVLDRGRQPVAGAVIGLYSRSNAPALGRKLLWQGYTQTDGRALGKFMRRIDLNEFDLVVQKPGYIGAYHDENLRTQVGVFAPSSQVLLRATQLSSYTATLWKK
jgi:hypothetical protein